MNPFTITCTTCQARLRVRKADAIGQILACPKCQSMVQVVPPPGWSPDVEPPQASESASRPPSDKGQATGDRRPNDRAKDRHAQGELRETLEGRPNQQSSGDRQPDERVRQEARAGDTQPSAARPDTWRSPQEQTARKLLWMVGAPVTALALTWGGWSLFSSRSVNDDSPPVAANPVTAAPAPAGDPAVADNPSADAGPVLADASTRIEPTASADISADGTPGSVEAWLPRDAHFVAAARPADVRAWAGVLRRQEVELPRWWRTLEAAIDGLKLDESTVDRALVAMCDVGAPDSDSVSGEGEVAEAEPRNDPDHFVILIELAAPGAQLAAMSDGRKPAGFFLGDAQCYESGDEAWPYPWALVDARTLVTGTRPELERLNSASADGSSSPGELPPSGGSSPESSLAPMLALGRPLAESNAWIVAVDRDGARHFDSLPPVPRSASSDGLADARSALAALPRFTAVAANAGPDVACEFHWRCDDAAAALDMAAAVEQLLPLIGRGLSAETNDSEIDADLVDGATSAHDTILANTAPPHAGSPLALLPWWHAAIPCQHATVEVDAETVVLHVSWAEDLAMLSELAEARFEAIENARTTAEDLAGTTPEAPPDAVSPTSIEEIPRDEWFDPTAAAPPSGDVGERLDTPLDGLDLPAVRLVDWLDFVSQVTGIRVTLDLRTLTAVGLSADRPIHVSASATTARAALADSLAELDLEPIVWGDHVVVTQRAPNDSSLDVRQYEIDDLVRNEQEAAQLAAATQQLVRPDVWAAAGGTSSIEVAGTSLEVHCGPTVHRAVEHWLAALRAARVAAAAGSEDSASHALLLTRRRQAAATLDQPVTLNFFAPTPLRTILEALEHATGAVLLLDGLALAEGDVPADVTATLVVDGRPLGEALDGLAESLGLAVWVADERTVQITTRSAARQRFELGFYEVASLPGADGTAEAIVGPLERELSERCGDAAVAGGSWYYDAPSGYLAVFQSQPVHAEIERYFSTPPATH